MSYFGEVYTRFYSCIVGVDSWMVYGVLFFILGAIALIIQDSNNKYKKRILYFYICSLSITFVLRILLWIFLPSPELLGLAK